MRANNTISAGTYDFDYLTRNRILLEAMYRGSWVVGKIIDAPAEDMVRAGVDITTSEDDKDVNKIKAGMSRLKIWHSLCLLAKWGELYGGAIGVLQVEGQDPETPLDLDTVDEGQFQGIVVFDRWLLNPHLQDVIDSGPDMGLPAFYDIVTSPLAVDPTKGGANGTQTIHHSRVIRYAGIDLPYLQAITEMMWGESRIERVFDRLVAFDNVTMSAANLVDRANLRMVGIEGLREIIAAGGQAYEGLLQMFEAMRELQINDGLTLLDKNDEFQAVSYSFSGLSDMMLQFAQQLAGASDIPLVRFFNQSPAGLNATGDSDMRMYYDSINAKQEVKYRNGMETILRLMWRSTLSKPAPDDLSFTFTPLWQQTPTDKANIAKTNTETILAASELTGTATALSELRDSSGDTGLFAGITDEQIADAKELDDNPPVPDMPPGMAGEKDVTGSGTKQLPPGPQTAKTKEAPKAKAGDSKPLQPHERINLWLKRQDVGL